ncbi:hypothetical protein [Kaarinaea lacus]
MKYILIGVVAVLLVSCGSPYSSHTGKVRTALKDVNYDDGINKTEANAIADAYLIKYGAYKGRASYARIKDGEDVWLGEVIVVKSLATPVNAELPPVVIHKKSGSVGWQYGPEVKKINLDDIDAEPKHTS